MVRKLNRKENRRHNSCLWLLWNLVELPFRNHIFVKPKIKRLRNPQQTTGSGTLADISKKNADEKEIHLSEYNINISNITCFYFW